MIYIFNTNDCDFEKHNIVEAIPLYKILENIKIEINDLDVYFDNDYFSSNNEPMFLCTDVIKIIDKYIKKGKEKYETETFY